MINDGDFLGAASMSMAGMVHHQSYRPIQKLKQNSLPGYDILFSGHVALGLIFL